MPSFPTLSVLRLCQIVWKIRSFPFSHSVFCIASGQMLSSVLYQDDSGRTTLLDLPLSIENGQELPCAVSVQRTNRILSAPPPEQPYPSIEPKGLKREKLLAEIPRTEQKYHQEVQALISNSLQEIRAARGERLWLLPRKTTRRFIENTRASIEASSLVVPEPRAIRTIAETPIILSSIPNVFTAFAEIEDRTVTNPSNSPTHLIVEHQTYHIPPCSTFLLSDVRRLCSNTTRFPNSVFPQSFDFIIMDPPWQNRSVRHAKTYQLPESHLEDPFLNVLPVLDSHLKPYGLVGIWVTNKARIRHLVLHSLYQTGFKLQGEWIWVKTTASGDPVTPLDGLWRRPYETFLLFGRDQSHVSLNTDILEEAKIPCWVTGVPRRILVAVPGHHSQKPSLKEFIEPLFANATKYRALEIFARNLTAGWFSYGDEVLKYNWEGNWAQENDG